MGASREPPARHAVAGVLTAALTVLTLTMLPASGATAGDHLEDRREALRERLIGLLEPVGVDGVVREVPDGYEDRVRSLPEGLREVMTGTSWHEGCPVGLDDLRLLEVVHHTLDGDRSWGRLVVHEDVVADLRTAFAELYARGFPIERMHLIDRFDGDDDASMAANNSSAFNCRPITGSDRWSEHAYGRAVDLNPVQNPYVRDGEVLPPDGHGHLDRDDVRPGMLVRPGPVEAFDRIGWGWGGDWSTLRDYMHVSETGR